MKGFMQSRLLSCIGLSFKANSIKGILEIKNIAFTYLTIDNKRFNKYSNSTEKQKAKT